MSSICWVQGGAWNDYNRNFTLAKKCLKKMAEMGYKVCVLSKDVSKEPELAPFVKSGNIIVHKAGAETATVQSLVEGVRDTQDIIYSFP